MKKTTKQSRFSLLQLKKQHLLFLVIFLSIAIFTRFYNIDITARFTQDESTDLVRMHQYWTEKKLTLVGPISTDNSKVFSSLTYYMLMPFAALAGFEPISPVYGTAFWGVITSLLLLWIVVKINPSRTYLAVILVLIWYPLLEMSRWAWNPHLVVFWSSLGMLCYLYKDQLRGWGLFLTGVFLSMLFHHHYVALFATAPFVGWIGLEKLKEKNFRQFGALSLGYLLPFIPFIIFDLRHPPGLFFSRYLLGSTPHVDSGFQILDLAQNLARNYWVLIESAVMQYPLQVILAIALPLLLLIDLKNKQYRCLLWLLPVIGALVGGIILNEFQSRYIYPAFGFLFVWLIFPRAQPLAHWTSQGLIGLLILGSLLSLPSALTETKVRPDIRSFTLATSYIAETIQREMLDNTNIAALAGSDPAPLAEKYRDIVRLKGGDVRESSEYDVSENLFVVSTNTETNVRADESYAMHAFQNASLKNVYEIPDSNWSVYWYGY